MGSGGKILWVGIRGVFPTDLTSDRTVGFVVGESMTSDRAVGWTLGDSPEDGLGMMTVQAAL